MSLELRKYVTALSPGLQTSAVGAGGTAPYAYAVLPGGAGGSIDAVTGVYSAPAVANLDPKFSKDTIQVTDNLGATATGTILVTSPLGLFAEIIQREMAIVDDNHIYFWNQKLLQPNDQYLYVALSVLRCRAFANVNKFDPATGMSIQALSMGALVSVDLISRTNEALFRKEEVLLALNSNYAKFQQSANSFYIGRLPSGNDFINLSVIDGPAIPYRFRITVGIQYTYVKNQFVPYFDTFETPEVTAEA